MEGSNECDMTVRLKSFLVGYTVLILFGAAIYITSLSLILPGFADIEVEDMREDLQRVAHLLDHELTTMSATAADWAEWDDTYQFMADGNAGFIDSNMVANTFLALDFNAVFLVDVSGDIVFSQAVDPLSGDVISPPAQFDAFLRPGSPLLVHDGTTSSRAGIVQLPSGPAAVAANAILTSLDEGPARGTLIWLRYLDDRTAARIENLFDLPVTFYPFDAAGVPDDVRATRSLLASETTVITPESAQTLKGYRRLDDLYGDPALMIALEKPRTMTAHGAMVVRTVLLVLLCTGVVALLVLRQVFNRMVLSRLSRLTAVMQHIRNTGDLSVPVPVGGRDEFGLLASGFASMLESLREARDSIERSRDELEQRVAERTAELRQSKEDAEAILANTSDAIVQVDPDRRIVRANTAFERMFEYRWDEIARQPIETVVPPAGREKLRDALEAVADTQTAGRIDLTVQRMDRSTFDAEVALSSVFEEDGQLRSVIAVFRDVTERKNAELRQAQLLAGLRRVLSLASELITSTDTDDLCRRAVEALKTDLGLERCAIFLENDGYLFGTYGVDGHGRITDEHDQRIPMNDSIWKSRKRLIDRDKPRWIEIHGPHYEWDGEQIRAIGEGWIAITPILSSRGFLGVLFNDTAVSGARLDPLLQEVVTVFCSLFGALYEQKRAEEAVKNALDQQIELNTLRMRFVSMVSHEFRTPLAIIQSSMDILLHYGDRVSQERRQEHLMETERQVQQMKALMEEYLTFDRSESGRLSVELASCNMVVLCGQVIDELRRISPNRDITFTAPSDQCELWVDRNLLRQALANLVGNALKYSEPPSVVSVELNCTDAFVRLSVRDEGIGIPESEQGYLFQSFFRASNTQSRPGTGLGLSIVKRAVEAHDGTVEVASQVNVGTTVTLTFPTTGRTAGNAAD